MKHQPPVIPFLFFVAVIITLSSIAVYAGLKYQFIRTVPPVVVNKASAQEPATTEPGEANVMEELKKDPQATEKFGELMKNFQLVKFVKISNGYIFEIGTNDNSTIGSETSLWRAEDGNQFKIITSYAGDCSDFSWSINGEKIIVNQMTSPCEAFANYTYKELDFYGRELVNLAYSSTGSAINFSNEQSTIAITPNVKGTPCQEKNYDFQEATPVPKTLFNGIIINGVAFNIAKPEEVPCAPAYGESLADPELDTPTLKDGILSFGLPNGQTVTIDTNTLIPDKAAPKKLDKTAVTIK